MPPTLLLDHVVATDAALVSLQVTMLGDGGFTVAGTTAVELDQETFHCYFRQLADATPPGLADELCAAFAADVPPAPDPALLAGAGAPLPAGVYDVLATSLVVTSAAHAGVRLGWPGYSGESYRGDEWGVHLRPPYEPSQPYYGHRFGPSTPGQVYRATVQRVGLVLLPLVHALDPARVEHYARQLARGGRPTVLAFGCYGSERSAALLVLDGHHKLAAAARTGLPIHLIAFLSPRVIANYAALDLPGRPPPPILPAARRNLRGEHDPHAETRDEDLAEQWQARAEARHRAPRRGRPAVP